MSNRGFKGRVVKIVRYYYSFGGFRAQVRDFVSGATLATHSKEGFSKRWAIKNGFEVYPIVENDRSAVDGPPALSRFLLQMSPTQAGAFTAWLASSIQNKPEESAANLVMQFRNQSTGI